MCYVGTTIAVALANKGLKVIEFDLNKKKIELYKSGNDQTRGIGNNTIKNTTVQFTSSVEDPRKSKFHIVTAPTPVNNDHTPDLFPITCASRILGRNLIKGYIVVYE